MEAGYTWGISISRYIYISTDQGSVGISTYLHRYIGVYLEQLSDTPESGMVQCHVLFL